MTDTKPYKTHDCRTPEQRAAGVPRRVKVAPYTLVLLDAGDEEHASEAWQCLLCGAGTPNEKEA